MATMVALYGVMRVSVMVITVLALKQLQIVTEHYVIVCNVS